MTFISDLKKKKHMSNLSIQPENHSNSICHRDLLLIDLLIDSPISVLELSDLSCVIAARRYQSSYRQLCKSRFATDRFGKRSRRAISDSDH